MNPLVQTRDQRKVETVDFTRQTYSKLIELSYELLPHPPYSPELGPCDFLLFPNSKKSIVGQTFKMRRYAPPRRPSFQTSRKPIFQAKEVWNESFLVLFDKESNNLTLLATEKTLSTCFSRCDISHQIYFNSLYNIIFTPLNFDNRLRSYCCLNLRLGIS